MAKIGAPIARKDYRCDGPCNGTIQKGQRYSKFYVYYGRGSGETFRMCSGCHKPAGAA